MRAVLKRVDEIADYLDEHGYRGYRAQRIAARATRAAKRGTGVDELMPRWIAELESAGWTVERLATALDHARRDCTGLAPRLTNAEIDKLATELLDPEGDFMARWKVFTRTRLVAEVAPMLYGHDPAELDHVVNRIEVSRCCGVLRRNLRARNLSSRTIKTYDESAQQLCVWLEHRGVADVADIKRDRVADFETGAEPAFRDTP